MRSVRGDFYDYLLTDEQRVGLFLADAAGHGVPAALICSTMKLAIRILNNVARGPPNFCQE